jgi:hypothetical protein
MIDKEDRMINQLLGCVYKDKRDQTIIRINMDKVASILTDNGYNLPAKQFEDKVQEVLDVKLVGKQNVSKSTPYTIALVIKQIADKYHIDERLIIKYITEHNTEQDVKEIQQKIDNWRKQYYGSLPKNEKAALLETLHERMRPDVLDKIKRS